MKNGSRQGVLFKDLADKPVAVRFSVPAQSSDGGLVLLKAIDQRLGLTEKLAAAIRDPRQPGKTDHALVTLLRQRIYSIASGYAQGSAAARMGDDPVMRLVCGREPLGEDVLASQPTLSRLENAVPGCDRLRMSYALANLIRNVVGARRGRCGGW